MLRVLRFKDQRSELERIYFAFVGPFLEYGSIIWDSASRQEKNFSEMEKLQIQAGCNNFASKLLLHRDTGWDTLRDMREGKQRHKALVSYKGGLRRHDFCSRLLAICIAGSREESYTIVCNRVESYLIGCNREESGIIIFDLYTTKFTE